MDLDRRLMEIFANVPADRNGANGSDAARRLAEKHVGLARRVAGMLKATLPPHVDQDMLESAAHLGLFDAARTFDPARGVRFATYAVPRIRGAALDAMRRQDHGSRRARAREKAWTTAEAELANRLGHRPSQQEVLDALGWTETDAQAARVPHVCNLSEPYGDQHQLDEARRPLRLADAVPDRRPPENHEASGARSRRWDLITRGLGLEDRIVLYLYHAKDNTMKEIGRILGLSESRVSQLHSRAIEWLRRNRSRDELIEALEEV